MGDAFSLKSTGRGPSAASMEDSNKPDEQLLRKDHPKQEQMDFDQIEIADQDLPSKVHSIRLSRDRGDGFRYSRWQHPMIFTCKTFAKFPIFRCIDSHSIPRGNSILFLECLPACLAGMTKVVKMG